MQASAPSTDADIVNAAVDALLAEHDPSTESYAEFRGHQFDAGLAFLHFRRAMAGSGCDPSCSASSSSAREAGAKPMNQAQFFMYLAGPTIVTHGSDAQKERFLRPMFTGEERWCQLFSEPGAGSDFAGLAASLGQFVTVTVDRQRAEGLEHDGLQNWGMLVTRSDPNTPKHKGMTCRARHEVRRCRGAAFASDHR
ncbi:MAG: acyl-CoA dehydrogenase family protein [Acidimicrobiales bacterium]